MRIGIFADSHDHLDNLRLAVTVFNDAECHQVLFAGDLVSTIAVPPLRKLKCPFVGCFGDNEGNKAGLLAGVSLVGKLSEPPVLFESADGTRFGIAHMRRQLDQLEAEYDIAVYAHTHKPRVGRDEQGRLCINPGETGGWTYREPTVAILETDTMEARLVRLTVNDSLAR